MPNPSTLAEQEQVPSDSAWQPLYNEMSSQTLFALQARARKLGFTTVSEAFDYIEGMTPERPDALVCVARMAIDAYHKTRKAEEPADRFVAALIKPWLEQAGIEVRYGR